MILLFSTIINNFLRQEYFGEKLSNYLLCIGIILVTLVMKKWVAILLTRISGRFDAVFSYMHHKSEIKNMLLRPLEQLLMVIAFSVAFNQLSDLLEQVELYHAKGKNKFVFTLNDLTDHVFLFLLIVFLTIVVNKVTEYMYYFRLEKAHEEKNNAALQLLPLSKELTKLLIWTLSIFWILGSVFHVNIPALVTGLGIGGVAIALAGKETLENFLAAFTLLSDKPFQVGDYIRVNELEGTVERIGFRSTRLRGLNAALIVVPNQKLVSQNLVNLADRKTQGLKLTFNIRYGISHENLKAITVEVEDYLRNNPEMFPDLEVYVFPNEKETLQLIVGFHIIFPLTLTELGEKKNEITLHIYNIISKYGELGFQGVSVPQRPM
jgi:MscS family membrane protein